MIRETSTTYWSTGITVWYVDHAGSRDGVPFSGWAGSLDYLDDGFCSDDADANLVSTEGELRTRYAVQDGGRASGLSRVIDTLLVDAARLGVEFRGIGDRAPSLYYKGDGEWPDYPPPNGWQALLAGEAARIGWVSVY